MSKTPNQYNTMLYKYSVTSKNTLLRIYFSKNTKVLKFKVPKVKVYLLQNDLFQTNLQIDYN